MRTGATFSGLLHGGLIVFVLFGADFLVPRDPPPMSVTEIEFIDGADFDARLSTAPVVPNQGPAEMAPPQERPNPEIALDDPDLAVAYAAASDLAEESAPPEAAPEQLEITMPAPPVVVPTEAPRMSIAEIPTPDALDRQALAPESPESGELVSALASAPSMIEAPQPSPPPPPDPVPAEAEEPKPEPEETETEPEPEAVAEAQPKAPLSNAPQEARLPVARPAELAAAAQASSAPKPRSEPAPEPEKVAEKPKVEPLKVEKPKPEKAEKPEKKKPEPEAVAEAPAKPKAPEPKAEQPPTPAAGSTSQFAAKVTAGEKDALRVGIKQHFYYNGDRSDRSLRVTVAIGLSPDGKIVSGPKQIDAQGGNTGAQKALYDAGRRALIKAQSAGEFAKLPAQKYDGWKQINVTFTPEEIGFSS